MEKKKMGGKGLEEDLGKGLKLRIDSGHDMETAFTLPTVECHQ